MQPLAKIVSQSLSQSSETPQSAFEKAQYLTAAKTLLGCYRTGDANDPEVYITAAVRVLSAFPLDVVTRVIDPVTGLPGRSKWLPTVSEIREACQEIHGLHQRMDEWEAAAAAQLAERQRIDAERAARPNGDQLRAKHGPTFGLDPELTKPIEDEAAIKRRRGAECLATFTKKMILAEYRKAGVEPIYSGQVLVSPTLLRSLGRWPPQSKAQPEDAA